MTVARHLQYNITASIAMVENAIKATAAQNSPRNGAEAAGIEMQGCGAFLNFTSWKDCTQTRDACHA
jgi:hypothetical protein